MRKVQRLFKRRTGGTQGRRPLRRKDNLFVTKSGQTIRVNRGMTARMRAKQAEKARRRAERRAGMPKSRIKRIFFRLHPKRLYRYWFSRDGLIMALKLTGLGVIAGFLLLVGVFAYFRKDLPNLKDPTGNNLGGSIRYYDRTEKVLLWEDYDAVKRIPVKEDDIAQVMKDATIAIEDKDFFKHGGFDARGILRAGLNNLKGGGGTQGGSTITQQLVKLTQDWSKDRSYTRKVKELILSVELERNYSKKEILTGYLNTAPYGSIDYGVEAATRDYFGKSAKDLSVDEAAFLASIPKSPAYYSPYNPAFTTNGGKEAVVGRMQYILDLMKDQGYITKEQYETAKQTDIIAKIKPRKPKYDGITAPYFVLTAREQLENKYGSENVRQGGWKVITTLDLNLQKMAEETVANGLAQVKKQGGDVAAFAAEDVKTGQMVALVGGPDFSNKEYGQNNYAHDYQLPPGSSFKPYDYTALIENTTNFGAGSVLFDTQGVLDGYPCTNKGRPKNGGNCLHNYDFRYPGPLTLRYALGGSRNVPAVKAMLITGVDKTIETAHHLMTTYKDGKPDPNKGAYKCYNSGVDISQATPADEAQCYSSSAIGDGAYLRLDEHVHGFASISRHGLNLPQTYILKVEDAGGKVLDEWKLEKGEQVVRPDAAYIVADILSDPNASYMSRKPHRHKDWRFGYKTGTTNDSKDGWMMGFSTQYAAGVWVGYHNRQVEMRGFMENMTQPILTGWMNKAHDNLPAEERQRPSGVAVKPAYVVRTHVGVSSVEPSPANDLYPSWYVQPKKSGGKKKVIDQVSNKLATDCTPQLAKKEIDEADALSFSGDRFVSSNANTAESDDVHKCDDLKPAIRLTVSPTGSGYSFTADVTSGTHPLSSDQFKGTVNFMVDGQIITGGSFSVDSAGIVGPVNYSSDFVGTRSVTVQIIDSVLYDSVSEAIPINGSGSGGGVNINPPPDTSASSTTISWAGGTGPFTVKLKGPVGGFNSYCSNTSGSSCPGVPLGLIGQYEVYIEDSNGPDSNHEKFNRTP